MENIQCVIETKMRKLSNSLLKELTVNSTPEYIEKTRSKIFKTNSPSLVFETLLSPRFNAEHMVDMQLCDIYYKLCFCSIFLLER